MDVLGVGERGHHLRYQVDRLLQGAQPFVVRRRSRALLPQGEEGGHAGWVLGDARARADCAHAVRVARITDVVLSVPVFVGQSLEAGGLLNTKSISEEEVALAGLLACARARGGFSGGSIWCCY